MLKKFITYSVISLSLLGCVNIPLKKDNPSEQTLSNLLSMILRAEGSKAINETNNLSRNELSKKDAKLLSCIEKRLTNSVELREIEQATFEEKILMTYQNYWFNAIHSSTDYSNLENQLLAQLGPILGLSHTRDITEIEQIISKRLLEKGYFSLQGKTGKLRELMLWKNQKEKFEKVVLSGRAVETKVYYLDDFLSFGWSGYFSCGRTGTGGWAKTNGLYVVTPKWKNLNNEKFKVSFLAHESQHFLDYSSFPNLKGWELEYRAKLVELSLANKSQATLIKRFISNQGKDPSDAHSYANSRVIDGLITELGLDDKHQLERTTIRDISVTAEKLLDLDTEKRLKN